MTAIDAVGLRKSFGEKTVLDGIDLQVAAGSVFALLGPNGAGKTTAVRILTTLIRADGGAVRVAGHDVVREADAVRAAIGVTGQFSAVDDLLTARENLIMMADLHRVGKREGRARTAELLAQFDLEQQAGQVTSTFSGGQKRRLDLAMTLVGRPSVIFLDEPTTGLDPRSRRGLWDIVRGLASSGVTIFLTTQYLEEADQLADRIAVLDGGRLVAQGTVEELKRLVPGGHVELRFTDPRELDAAAAALGGPAAGSAVHEGTVRDDTALTLRVPNDGSVKALRSLLDRLDSAAVTVNELTVHTPDLDDVFFAVTGQAGIGSRDAAVQSQAHGAAQQDATR